MSFLIANFLCPKLRIDAGIVTLMYKSKPLDMKIPKLVSVLTSLKISQLKCVRDYSK